ncbi:MULTISPECIES: isoaspartyl peptidase/L-asparaginase [unclassified Sphingomonas]|uniref:isoaspartyl peptidase/L-asparaginase family protein n=1 Tax=unclassified Sphingomonas TaxID=196159 RepID=UPI000E753FC9|nr:MULTISPECIES: isoaspartyl peptidase/L-asparaginase [unclassified Sphingomonas]RKE43751.1 beta-aspartyl-peptidase (threonine type) [Sphingomonas sp. PP-CC-1A-547]TCM05978.1 beta-aspartyl-peptidase (threonine type) [Sphingomonas sp. PP-CC-3G-468]
MTWTLVIHGGAGKLDSEMVSPEQDAGARAGLSRALDIGSKALAEGGSALDAVEAAVRVLEDDPHFNSGRGAVFTHDGTLELDAAIMDGRTRAAGAVAAATATRNPVGLARAILDDGRHVFLAGKGADAFSREHALPQADADWFATDERRRQFAEFQADGGGFDVDMKYGTVGAVACDAQGHVAAATSTGGVTGKRWGRIGDTPVIGAGTFADDRACAVSCTGSGEFFLRVGVGHEIAARVRFAGESLQVAADAVLADVKALGGTGGVIVTGPDGDMAWGFNTVGMYRGTASSAGSRTVAIYANEPA